MNPIVMAIIVSIAISLLSLLGVVFLKISRKTLRGNLLTLVGLATGALLGDAFLHLIPESINTSNPENSGLGVIVGIIIFFVLEKILKWRHCHEIECQNEKNLAGISLIADSIHNLIDGLIIGGSFLVNPSLGMTNSIAILMHEIPQEIGDLAIMVHSGMSLKRAAGLNLISALFSLIGVIAAAVIGRGVLISGSLMSITAGGFIYLAASDLIPELHRHQSKIGESLWQLLSVSLGIGIMYFLV